MITQTWYERDSELVPADEGAIAAQQASIYEALDRARRDIAEAEVREYQLLRDLAHLEGADPEPVPEGAELLVYEADDEDVPDDASLRWRPASPAAAEREVRRAERQVRQAEAALGSAEAELTMAQDALRQAQARLRADA